MRVLLVEDHQDIAGVIFDFFEMREGYVLDYASDGLHGYDLAMKQHFDLIVLDIMLPGMDGLAVCQKLRENGIDTPVLMLTARDNQQDVLDGFAAGADDYLTKPFDLNILEARLQALHRRRTGVVAKKKLAFEDVTLDLIRRHAEREGQQIRLGQIQFIILKTLMTRAPEVAGREELIRAIWMDEEPEGDLLRSHIFQLRAVIDKPFDHAYIATVPKVGYRLMSKGSQ